MQTPSGTAQRGLPLYARSCLPAAAVAVLGLIIAINAWLSDDAYITLRTIDNFVHGYGLRWNIAERVQAFTHPLWLMVLAGPYALTREHYFTSIVVSLVVTMFAAGLLATRVVRAAPAAAAGIVLLMGSKAFVDYSTSGLENPLSHALLAGFFCLYWQRQRDNDTLVGLSLVASLCLLVRFDLAVLVLPSLARCLLRARSLKAFWQVALGTAPFVAWEAFSIVYYGFPVPNTAYAKLATGVPLAQAMAQGLVYLRDSWGRDPLTLAVIALGLAVPAPRGASPRRADWPVRLGIVGYLAYIVWIGGDFMSGRFLTPPFFVAVLRLARWLARVRPVVSAAVAACALVVAALSPTPTFLGNYNYTRGEAVADAAISATTNISDERRFYWQLTGLLSPDRGSAADPWFKRKGEEARRQGTPLAMAAAVGMWGFYGGPGLHLVDAYGLAEPLLARLPPVARWRIGHYRRALPAGYWETLASGRNVIRDPGIRVFYSHLASITRGPIWSAHRFHEIVRMNLGLYDRLLPAAEDAGK